MEKIPTGNTDLDEFLEGGYETDVITTIYGPAGSGKTNLCLLAAVNVAKTGKKVVFIDTEGGFSVDRLNQLTNEGVLNNILLLKATSFKEQEKLFDRLLEEVNSDLGLIIVDSIVMMYRLEVGLARENGNHEKITSINRSMSKQLRILSEISRKRLIPIIITDQVYSNFSKDAEATGREVHMVGGDLLKYWSKCIIELKRSYEKRRLILRKHRSLAEKEFQFYINNKGISKAGFRLFN